MSAISEFGEEQELEKPDCAGCKFYAVVKRDNERPREKCKLTDMRIENGFISSRSMNECPKGRGRKNAKRGNQVDELSWATPRVPRPAESDNCSGPSLYECLASAEPSRGMVQEERPSVNIGDHNYSLGSISSLRDIDLVGEYLSTHLLWYRSRNEGRVPPRGYAVHVPVSSAAPLNVAEGPEGLHVPVYSHRVFTWTGASWSEERG